MGSEAAPVTVVLVHGAFADAASWAPVTQRLIEAEVPVTAIVNPLRGVQHDAAYVASVINQIDGPVLAVGHSYGGMIITNAVPRTSNVVGLVYVAAFAPDEGETLAGIVGRSEDSVLTTAVIEYQFPLDGGGTAGEFIIDPEKFRAVFTHDLSELDSAVYGLSQRPIAASALGDETGHPAWKDHPVWAAVGTGDKAAGADVVLQMAQRAGADITEIEGSHVIMISQPDKVTDVILKAYNTVQDAAGATGAAV
jgi:pimeloyl-ACP methyl ester carboxylesterase